MLSVTETQILALVTYGWLAAWVAYGHPHLPRGTSMTTGPPRQAGWSRSGEAVWLGALTVVFLYPLIVLLAPDPLLSSVLTAHFAGDGAVQLVGVGSILVGGGLVGWAFRSLGRYATVQIQISEGHCVVRNGAYARMRHPMYTANILLSVGIALAFLAWTLWIPVVVVLILAWSRARAEEEMFLASPDLGPAYARYMTDSGRFLPRCS